MCFPVSFLSILVINYFVASCFFKVKFPQNTPETISFFRPRRIAAAVSVHSCPLIVQVVVQENVFSYLSQMRRTQRKG